MHTRSFTVPAGDPATRLDVFLGRHAPCSRRTAQRLIASGTVRVNGRRVRKGQSVQAGDVVEVPEEHLTVLPLRPNPALAIAVLYEDAAVIAVDKPAGMPSHALRAEETDTVANFLLARYPELAAVGKNDREPGIVHRLDTETSGVLLAARTPDAYARLREQFAAHRVTKEYVALVQGDVAAGGEISTPISHDRHNRRKMRVGRRSARSTRSRPAETLYRPTERFGPVTLLAVTIRTGVRHQIRVHLAALGHPIVGDRLYGGEVAEIAPPRQLLHAARVVFMHPVNGTAVQVDAPLPADFNACLGRLREAAPAVRGGARKAFP